MQQKALLGFDSGAAMTRRMPTSYLILAHLSARKLASRPAGGDQRNVACIALVSSEAKNTAPNTAKH